MRIEYRGVVRHIMTPYEVRPSEWDSDRGVLVLEYAGEGRKRRLLDYSNAMVRDLRLIDSIIRNHPGSRSAMGRSNILIADDIANTFRTAVSARRMLGVYAAMLHDELMLAGQFRTARGYLTATRRLIDFNHGYDIPLDWFCSEKIVAFQQSLLGEGISRPTVSFYMRTLRAIYNKAVSESVIPACLENPFLDAYTEVSVKPKESRAAAAACYPETVTIF